MTSRVLRTFVAATAAVALLSPLATQPASAAEAAVAVMAGTGTSTPGIPATGCADQTSVTMDLTMTFAGSTGGTYAAHFDGSSNICESLASGQGSGTLSGGVSGVVNYQRTGTVMTLSGSFTVNGTTYNTIIWICFIAWVSYPPPGSWVVVCVWV